MEQRNILVTGCAGFIGSHLSEFLLRQGHAVTGVDEINDYYDISIKHNNLSLLESVSAETKTPFSFYQIDICDRDEMEAIIIRHRISHVIHLAARAGVRASIQQPDLYIHSNVLGSTVMFDLATKHMDQIKHVVYASSSSVYGMNDKVPFSETDSINRIVSPYAASKKAAESIATAYANMHKFPITGLRFFTVYGPRGRPDMAPFKFVDRIMKGETIDQYGTGNSSRDYTYIDDIVQGIVKSMDRPLEGREFHEVYNLGNSSPVTLREFIELVETVCGKKAIRRMLPDQKGDVEKTFADVSKAYTDFGYAPKTQLATGLRKLAEWWKMKYAHVDSSVSDLGYVSGSSDADLSESSTDI